MIKADRTKLVPTKKKLTSPEVAPQRAEPSSPLHHRMRVRVTCDVMCDV